MPQVLWLVSGEGGVEPGADILLMGLIFSCVIFSYPFLRVSFVTEELEDIEGPQRVWK